MAAPDEILRTCNAAPWLLAWRIHAPNIIVGPWKLTYIERAISSSDTLPSRPIGPTTPALLINKTLEVLAHVRASETRACRSARLPPCRSEEHTSDLQSLMRISYAVFCLQK